ncbi:type II secretion system protein [Candidatus Omnitrophota bacterium]
MNFLPYFSRVLHKRNGHSLFEMITIIVILGILAAAIIPKVHDISKTAKINSTEKELVELQIAIMGNDDFRGYYEDVGSLPANLSDLYGGQEAGYNPFLQTGGRRGNYISDADVDGNGTADMLEDGWGIAYGWVAGTGVITSGGPDETIGVGGDDITLDVNG